jgi:4'-phosphopantetheinyl transferase EntD
VIPTRSRRIERLFGDLGVIAHTLAGPADPTALLADERVFTAGVSALRSQQFTAGRLCARWGLRALGVSDHALVVGAGGQPSWPEGICGSISHTKGLVVAVVAPTEGLGHRRIGVDAERLGRVGQHLHRHVFTDGEIATLAATSRPERLASTIFSAKEALYKAQYPLTAAWVGFRDVWVEIDGDRGLAHPATDLEVLNTLRWPASIGVEADDQHVVAGVVVEPVPVPGRSA